MRVYVIYIIYINIIYIIMQYYFDYSFDSLGSEVQVVHIYSSTYLIGNDSVHPLLHHYYIVRIVAASYRIDIDR